VVLFSLCLHNTAFSQSALQNTLQSAVATATANGTAQPVLGYATVAATIIPASSWDGTITFEISDDGTTYTSILCTNRASGATSTTYASTSVRATFACPVSGSKYFRARISGRTTGTVTVTARTVVVPLASNTGNASGVALGDSPTWPGTHTFSVNPIITNTAPGLAFTDTTASAKSLTIAVDANAADFRESAGAASSLLKLDLANNRVGIGVAPGTIFHLKGASPEVKLSSATTGQNIAFSLYDADATLQARLLSQSGSTYFINDGGNALNVYSLPAVSINFWTDGTVRAGMTGGGGFWIGPIAPTLTAGALGLTKITASASAPGAGSCKLEVVAGTNANTCKIIAACGTSATAVTVTDNIGTGC
jgi:hypothetical protein